MRRESLLLSSAIVLVLSPSCFKAFDDEAASDFPVGLSAMVRLVDVEPGAECAEGGVRVESGVDRDQDGVLEDDEVSGTKSLVCDPADGAGAPALLARVSEEPAGALCAEGGVRVESGVDTDGDGALDVDEVEHVEVLCSGAAGSDAGDGLVSLDDEPPGAACPDGGVRIDLGLDADGDGTLDPEEIAATEYACDGTPGAGGAPGEDGLDALVQLDDVAPGAACLGGGKRVEVGLDQDRDGQLDPEEVTRSSVVCHGADGGAGPGGAPPEGVSEGSAASPVVLDVGSRAGPPAHAGTVSAHGTSFYAFTTLADPLAPGTGDAPYTVSLTDFRSDVSVEVFSSADFASAPVDVSCRFLDVRTKLCSTATLTEGTPYYLAVTERDNLPGAYTLTVSFSADRGSGAAPISLVDEGTPAGGGFTLPGSVSGGGASEYTFTPPADGLFTVRVDGVRGAPGGAAPELSWEIYEGAPSSSPRLFACATSTPGPVACPTPYLRGGIEHRIRVVEAAGQGALYTLELLPDDVLTPRVGLAEVADLSATAAPGSLALFVPSTSGPHTVTVDSSPAGFSLFADVGAAQRGEPSAACPFKGCAAALEAARPVYLALRGSGAVSAYIDEGGGTEGALDAPLPVALDVTHRGSIGEGSDFSFYAFTTSNQPGPYSIELSNPPIGVTTVTCQVSADLERTVTVAGSVGVTAAGPERCVTDPLEANTSYYLRLDTDTSASRVDFTVRPGDTLTPTLSAGPPFVQDLTTDVIYRIVGAPGPYEFRLTGAAGPMVRRLYPGYPFNAQTGTYLFRCEINDRTSGANNNDCTKTALLVPGQEHYLRLDNRVAGANSLTVEVVARPPLDVTFGATIAAQSLPPLGELWYRVVLPADSQLSARLDFTASGDYRIKLYDESFALFQDTYLNWSATAGGTRTHTFIDGATPVPAGTWYLLVREGVIASETLTFDLTVTIP